MGCRWHFRPNSVRILVQAALKYQGGYPNAIRAKNLLIMLCGDDKIRREESGVGTKTIQPMFVSNGARSSDARDVVFCGADLCRPDSIGVGRGARATNSGT